MLIQRCINVVHCCLDVVSTFYNVVLTLLQRSEALFRRCFNVGVRFVSTLCNVENPISDFVSFSTPDVSNSWRNMITSLVGLIVFLTICYKSVSFHIYQNVFFLHWNNPSSFKKDYVLFDASEWTKRRFEEFSIFPLFKIN